MDKRPSDVIVAGISQTPVGEFWDQSIRQLGIEAILDARKDAGGLVPEVLYVGNLLAVSASRQANLGTLLAENAGLRGIEGVTVEAADASGGAALRLAYLAVRSGAVNTAMALGVEKFTDVIGGASEAMLAHMLDADYEAAEGLTPVGLAALLFKRYLLEYEVDRDALAGFPETAHDNASVNPNAMFKYPLRPGVYQQAIVSEDFTLYDVAPYADGAAAVLLTREDCLPVGWDQPRVRLIGSSLVTDTLSIHDRHHPLEWDAARLSVERACRAAGIMPRDVDFFEVHDATTLHTVLSLEAAGFASQGQGWMLGKPETIGLGGQIPITTFGGLKARGNPIGAAGIYQAVEATLQLRGQAGTNQVQGAKLGLIQCLGGMASTAAVHVLAADNG